MPEYVLAIDQGTTSSRAIVFDRAARVVASGQLEHEQIFPRAGWVEHDPAEIWNNVREAVGIALTRANLTAEDLAAVGITNQRETTVVWDRRTGIPVSNAIVWQDTRTQRIVDDLAGDAGVDRYKLSGDARVANTMYNDGGSIRVVYTPAQTHPWGTISAQTVSDQVAFWQEAFGAPNAIDSGSQTWQWKELFTTFGLIGFMIFLLAFARALLTTRAFAGLKAEQPVATANTRKGLAWFWGGLLVSALFSGVSYVLLSQASWMGGIAFNAVPSIFTQGAVFFIAFWAAINGVAAIVIMGLSYLLFGRKNGLAPRALGLLPGWRKFFQALGLAAVTVTAAYLIVFFFSWLLHTDFRWWVVAVKDFGPDKLWIALLYVPFFLVYFLANSIAINVFNRFTLRGKEWLNTLVLALVNALAPIVLVVAQYTTFFITGEPIPGFGGIFSIWLFPVILILAATAVLSRKLYRATGNPYIGGFISAAVVTLVAVTNTLTVVY